MPKKTTKLYIGGILYTLLFAGATVSVQDKDNDDKCRGSARWEVKVMADEEAEEVVVTPKITTIKKLTAIDTDDYTIGNKTERQDIEKQTYTVKNVFITKAILENDNDIHLVLEDGKKNTMIAELPDPDCDVTDDSRVLKKFAKARANFLRYQYTFDQYRFDVTGTLFIDKGHGQTGRAPNNVELHPVTGLKMVSRIEPDDEN